MLKVLTIERISTEHQDERSLDDQRAKSTSYVLASYEGDIEWRHIASRGSGEVTDRDSYREMEDLIDSGWPDLIITEDIGRICRRIDALRICELCEDFETRLIALNDHVDTFQPEWKMSAMFSALHHERHNQDTSDRIKRTLRNRFTQGAILVVLPYGYLREPDAKHDSQITKDPLAEKVYQRWFQMLDDGASYSEVADWLNAEKVPTGPGCKRSEWSPAMVIRITHNPILKGERRWNERTSKRVNRSGRRKSTEAPKELLLVRQSPHLAFIEPKRYDRILRKLDCKNALYRRGKALAKDARQGIPRSRTVWPGQSMYCGICGRVLYYGAHGNPAHLMCSGAIDYKCWNGASADGPDASRRICSAVKDLIKELPEFDDVLVEEVRNQVRELTSKTASRVGEIKRALARLETEKRNILKFIRSGSNSTTIAEELARLENDEAVFTEELEDLERSTDRPFELPSVDAIRQRGLDLFTGAAPETPEFGRLMNQFIEDLVVQPVQSIDGGRVGLRASFTVNLAALIEGEPSVRQLGVDALTMSQNVNLFDVPQRVQYLTEVVRLSHLNDHERRTLTERQIAEQLGITQPVVQRAKKLYREMQRRGINDPYQVITSPPSTGKLRRHLHKRYQFEPIRSAS